MSGGTVREAVGVFDSERALQDAADELLLAGFDRVDLSVLAEHADVVAHLGHDYATVAELEDDPNVATDPLPDPDARTIGQGALVTVGFLAGAMLTLVPLLSFGGWETPVAMWVVLGGLAGAAIGFACAHYFARRHRRNIRDQESRGGILLWVRAPDRAREQKACETLRRAAARDVHMHDHLHVDHPVDTTPYLDWISGIRGRSDRQTAGA